jgi:hypothetical protein
MGVVDLEVAANLHAGHGDIGAIEKGDRAQHHDPQDEQVTDGQPGGWICRPRCAWFNLHGFGLYRTGRGLGPVRAAAQKSQNLSQRGAKSMHRKRGKTARASPEMKEIAIFGLE